MSGAARVSSLASAGFTPGDAALGEAEPERAHVVCLPCLDRGRSMTDKRRSEGFLLASAGFTPGDAAFGEAEPERARVVCLPCLARGRSIH